MRDISYKEMSNYFRFIFEKAECSESQSEGSELTK